MSLSKLKYTKDWKNPDDFPTYSSDETQIRADMQLLFDEARAALNKLIDELDASEIPFTPTPEIQAADVRQALIAIQNQIAQIALGSLPDNSISSQKIMPKAVTEEKMADLSVTTRALAAKSISEPKLGDASVSTRTIKDGAVTRDKMAADAYNDKANLVNGRVAANELTRTVKYISESYTLVLDDLRKVISINPSTAVDITIPNNTNVAFPVGAEIDIMLRSSNTITIKGASGVTLSGPVTKLSVAGDAARLVKISTNIWSISVSGKVTNEGLSDGSVTYSKLAEKSVGTSKIADDAVTSEKISDGSVTRSKLAADALYSPVSFITNSSYSITNADSGKTLTDAYSARANPFTFSLTQGNSTNIPLGYEVAIIWRYCTSVTISFSGIRACVPGSGQIATSSSDGSVEISEKFGTIAMKKVESDNTYGDMWIITGNVEVVS